MAENKNEEKPLEVKFLKAAPYRDREGDIEGEIKIFYFQIDKAFKKAYVNTGEWDLALELEENFVLDEAGVLVFDCSTEEMENSEMLKSVRFVNILNAPNGVSIVTTLIDERFTYSAINFSSKTQNYHAFGIDYNLPTLKGMFHLA